MTKSLLYISEEKTSLLHKLLLEDKVLEPIRYKFQYGSFKDSLETIQGSISTRALHFEEEELPIKTLFGYSKVLKKELILCPIYGEANLYGWYTYNSKGELKVYGKVYVYHY